LEYQPDHGEAKTKLAELETQNRRNQRPRRNTPSNNSRRNRSFQTEPVGVKVVSAVPVSASDSDLFAPPPVDASETATREELFNKGVGRYREGDYAQAFETFLACLSVEGKTPLPSGSLAGDAGPLWKDFRTRLNVPSEGKILAEAVRFNPADRGLYVNLSMAGAKMGIDRKTLRTTLDRIHLHALERQ
jgi:hypothetical protein